MIHISVARKIINNKKPFNCKVWKGSTGDIITYNNVVCTSSNFKNNTINIKILSSGQIRKFRIVTLFEINDEEIYL